MHGDWLSYCEVLLIKHAIVNVYNTALNFCCIQKYLQASLATPRLCAVLHQVFTTFRLW